MSDVYQSKVSIDSAHFEAHVLGDEAAESAVEKSKLLLNRVIGRKILPENSEDDEEKKREGDCRISIHYL